MAITIKKKLGSSWYTPTSQIESEEPASFKLQELNREQLDDAMNGSQPDTQGNLRLSSLGIRSALKSGLVEWQGITDEAGNDVKCTPSNHRHLPWDIGQELAGEIVSSSLISDEEIKNS